MPTICGKCNVPLENVKTRFEYLGHEFFEETPRCPVCGQVYIPKEMVDKRMRPLEESLEEK